LAVSVVFSIGGPGGMEALSAVLTEEFVAAWRG
jgi:hypothetical protein